jgi:hypothetical protein
MSKGACTALPTPHLESRLLCRLESWADKKLVQREYHRKDSITEKLCVAIRRFSLVSTVFGAKTMLSPLVIISAT